MADALGLKIKLINKDSTKVEYEKFVKEMGNKKIDLKIDFDSIQMTNITKSIKKISDLIGTIDFSKVKGATILNDEMIKTGNSVKTMSNAVNELQSKQLKIVNGDEVQKIENIKKSLLETQKIIKNYKDGESTSTSSTTSLNYAKAQKELYGQMNKLQKDEFTLKGQLIGKDGLIKTELEKQLGLVKSQQTEVAKLVNLYGVKGEDNISKNLRDRATLVSNLIIKQETYNKALEFSNSKAQNKVDDGTKKTALEVEEQKLKVIQQEEKKALDLEAQKLKIMQQEERVTNTIQEAISKTIIKREQEAKVLEMTQSKYQNKAYEKEIKSTSSKDTAQQNAYLKESQSLLTQIYAKKTEIVKTDEKDLTTQRSLSSQLNELNNKQINNSSKITSEEHLIKLKQQKITLQQQLNDVESRQTYKIDTGESARIAKLGEQLKVAIPSNLFGKTTKEIQDLVKELYGAEAKITGFTKSAKHLRMPMQK